MKKLYSACYVVFNKEVIHFRVSAIFADNENEALGIVQKQCEEIYPVAEGFYNHRSDVMEVSVKEITSRMGLKNA